MSEQREYDVTVYYQTQRTYKVRARDRQQAIDRASAKAERAGLHVSILRVPFLEGDEA